MCGIAGFELRGDGDRSVANRLTERLSRRGPDGQSFAKVGPYGLVHTRLSIIDLSDRVRYPLRNEAGDLHLLFNGEIYDFASERARLERLGHNFATRCDAEVIVHGYEELGVEYLRQLDGMFALALVDERRRSLVLTRDALGIKPLVYTTGQRFAFASDALALVAAGLSRGQIDVPAMSEYLAFHYLPAPLTGLEDVIELEPGTALVRSFDGSMIQKRWRPRPYHDPPHGPPPSVEEVEDAIDRSVRRQLVADVPVGVFVSSGLDSSLVLDSAVRCGVRPTAFTIAFRGHGDYDEAAAAGQFVRSLDVEHVVDELDVSFEEAISDVAAAYDQPFADASAIATLAVSRLARGHVKVALSGTGGDDLFGGYYRHRVHRFHPVVRRVPPQVRALLLRLPGFYGAQRTSGVKLALSYVRRLAEAAEPDYFAQYLRLVGTASSAATEDLVHFTVAMELARATVAARHRSTTADSELRAIQAFELPTYLAGDLLAKEDRATMAVGLEGRVPLLGADLLALSERASDNQKVGLGSGKRLLRAMARRRLPQFVTRSRKRGFAVPLEAKFSGPWRSTAADWFAATPSALIDGPKVGRLLSCGGSLPATDAWALAALVAWEVELTHARRSANEVGRHQAEARA